MWKKKKEAPKNWKEVAFRLYLVLYINTLLIAPVREQAKEIVWSNVNAAWLGSIIAALKGFPYPKANLSYALSAIASMTWKKKW